jgi:DNA-binding transcriptional MocR family regulator
VAYVPGPPFHVGDGGRNTMRLSFSHLTETELETAAERLGGVVVSALSSEPARPRSS